VNVAQILSAIPEIFHTQTKQGNHRLHFARAVTPFLAKPIAVNAAVMEWSLLLQGIIDN